MLAFAQSKVPAQAAPPEADQALRARVTQFLQYHVEGNFIKAWALVAEDTKEYYFGANKIRLVDFKITDINYSDNFTKASVTAIITRMWRIHAEEEKVVVPMVTDWKVEDGKWVWYFDQNAKRQVMSMGESDPEAVRKSLRSGATPDLSPEAMQKAAQSILKQSSVDKSSVTLPIDKDSTETVVFHNGYPGSVMLSASVADQIAGFTAELNKTTLAAGEDAVLELRYVPTGVPPQGPVHVDLRLQPFNKVFPVEVKFGSQVMTGAPR